MRLLKSFMKVAFGPFMIGLMFSTAVSHYVAGNSLLTLLGW